MLGLEPVVNPPCWASETAVSLNLTIPSLGHVAQTNIAAIRPDGGYDGTPDFRKENRRGLRHHGIWQRRGRRSTDGSTSLWCSVARTPSRAHSSRAIGRVSYSAAGRPLWRAAVELCSAGRPGNRSAGRPQPRPSFPEHQQRTTATSAPAASEPRQPPRVGVPAWSRLAAGQATARARRFFRGDSRSPRQRREIEREAGVIPAVLCGRPGNGQRPSTPGGSFYAAGAAWLVARLRHSSHRFDSRADQPAPPREPPPRTAPRGGRIDRHHRRAPQHAAAHGPPAAPQTPPCASVPHSRSSATNAGADAPRVAPAGTRSQRVTRPPR